MFSKARRFGDGKNGINKDKKPLEPADGQKVKPKITSSVSAKPQPQPTPTHSSCKSNADTQSLCGSVRSAKSFVTPKPARAVPTKCPSSLKKPLSCKKTAAQPVSSDKKVTEDIIKSQESEIRNKDYTIQEYLKQIDDLKNEISGMKKQFNLTDSNGEFENLQRQVSELQIKENNITEADLGQEKVIKDLKLIIASLEDQTIKLEHEVSSKQVELSSLEELICIRDSLCKDLQDKLTSVETCLEETKQRLEMVKGHHALALEANESIRREYKVELETMKQKLEEEKQTIINKCKNDQEAIKTKYSNQIELLKIQMNQEKDDAVAELQNQIKTKDIEVKAKLEQIDEATCEKLKLCEIQFEERFRSIQEHWAMQEEKLQFLEKEANELKYSLSLAEEQSLALQREIKSLQSKNENLTCEKASLLKEVEVLRDDSKRKFIDFDNQINKLTVEVDKAMKEKNKYELSLSVTRDIVQVLTTRLRESDSDLDRAEEAVSSLTAANEKLSRELETYKSSLDTTVQECGEYKEALVNILKSKAALAAEHSRIIEHNATLAESLQAVEHEAYRELGDIKNELIEDVEQIKNESQTQIQMLRNEVQKKRAQVLMATETAGEAAAAAEAARQLLAAAAAEIERLETDNQRLNRQIQDQQSLVVELSLLRQENEELALTVAKQSSLIDKMKKEHVDAQFKPKSPSIMRKNIKIGKENSPIVISPLRERNV